MSTGIFFLFKLTTHCDFLVSANSIIDLSHKVESLKFLFHSRTVWILFVLQFVMHMQINTDQSCMSFVSTEYMLTVQITKILLAIISISQYCIKFKYNSICISINVCAEQRCNIEEKIYLFFLLLYKHYRQHKVYLNGNYIKNPSTSAGCWNNIKRTVSLSLLAWLYPKFRLTKFLLRYSVLLLWARRYVYNVVLFVYTYGSSTVYRMVWVTLL